MRKIDNQILWFLFLLLLVSCKPIDRSKAELCPHPSLLIGEWNLDSSSNPFSYSDRILFLKNGEIFWFLRNDGGSLYSKGSFLGTDTINLINGQKNIIQMIDSNHFKLTSSYSPQCDYFSRTTEINLQKKLKEYLEVDKYRKSILGWWKVIHHKKPIKFMNSDCIAKSFTLNINQNGSANFYLENKLDSVIEYSYRADINSINLQKGCLISNTDLFIDKNGMMKLILDNIYYEKDTLILKRIYTIN